MESIKVHFDDGNTLATEITGTREEIRAYYLGKYFELTEGNPVKAVRVEFLIPRNVEWNRIPNTGIAAILWRGYYIVFAEGEILLPCWESSFAHKAQAFLDAQCELTANYGACFMLSECPESRGSHQTHTDIAEREQTSGKARLCAK